MKCQIMFSRLRGEMSQVGWLAHRNMPQPAGFLLGSFGRSKSLSLADLLMRSGPICGKGHRFWVRHTLVMETEQTLHFACLRYCSGRPKEPGRNEYHIMQKPRYDLHEAYPCIRTET